MDSSYILTQPVPAAQKYSNTQFEIIKRYILDFQASLDNEHDIGVMLTHLGSSKVMEVTQISFEAPVLMIFTGYVDGRRSTLIQHINQINFLLTTIPKPPEKPHRTIGFTAYLEEQ